MAYLLAPTRWPNSQIQGSFDQYRIDAVLASNAEKEGEQDNNLLTYSSFYVPF